jgi:exocyst complex component 4
MSAFKDAGSRRRAMTNGSDDDYQQQRQEEFEAERLRQQRIQKKIIKKKGNAKAGDIDGELSHSPISPLWYSPLIRPSAVLDQIKDGWQFMIERDVRMPQPAVLATLLIVP